MAGTVSDVLDRRTQSAYRDARATAAAAGKVAALIGPELDWDDERRRAEAEAYATRLLADLTRAGLDPDPVSNAAARATADAATTATTGVAAVES
jgi:hypothetical protein